MGFWRAACTHLALWCALTSTACSRSYVARGSELYANQRYIEAAEVFERTEPRLGQYSYSERARYGLYRGLTLLALGDRLGAQRWFAYSYDIERRYPGALEPNYKAQLERGWNELGRQIRAAPQPASVAPVMAVGDEPDDKEAPTTKRALR